MEERSSSEIINICLVEIKARQNVMIDVAVIVVFTGGHGRDCHPIPPRECFERNCQEHDDT